MTHAPQAVLNQGQQEAAEGFFKFLFEQGTELIISGPGGVGKTFLMGHLIDIVMPRYEETCKLMGIPAHYSSVIMTATTNRAAEVLAAATSRPTQTIHSFLRLKVNDDYATGKTMLTRGRDWAIHKDLILFIDESSMIDKALLEMIRDSTCHCKIVYVGDHCQLAPIMEPISPIYRQRLPFFELTEPMRTDNPHLQAANDQLRDTVKTSEFKPIQIVPGIIDHLDVTAMQQAIDNEFKDTDSNSRILAYTNARVVQYNDYIRELRQFTEPYVLDERLINSSAIQLRGSNRTRGMIAVEEEVRIAAMAPTTTMEVIDADNDVELEVRYCDLESAYEMISHVPLPVDKDHFNKLVKYYQQQKNWKLYFHLKNTFPDLRPRDAATVHKAQGSTYDTVFIDLNNLSTCHNPNQAARLLYVAFTRARKRVVLYGDLASKYGGLLHT